MKQIQIVAMLVAIAIFFGLQLVTVQAGGFTYELVSFSPVDLNTGALYPISGTITTSCNDCVLSSADFLAWEINVGGPVPFDFKDSNGFVEISGDGQGRVVASPSSLTLASLQITLQIFNFPLSGNSPNFVAWELTADQTVIYDNFDAAPL